MEDKRYIFSEEDNEIVDLAMYVLDRHYKKIDELICFVENWNRPVSEEARIAAIGLIGIEYSKNKVRGYGRDPIEVPPSDYDHSQIDILKACKISVEELEEMEKLVRDCKSMNCVVKKLAQSKGSIRTKLLLSFYKGTKLILNKD